MPREGPGRLKGEALTPPFDFYTNDGTRVLSVAAGGAITLAPAAGTLGFYGVAPVAKPSAYTQTFATAAKTVPAATQLTPPAGGTGAAAGAYDTAANRDLMVASITAGAVDLDLLKRVVNALIDDLQALGLVG